MTLEPLQSCLFLHCSRCIALVTEHGFGVDAGVPAAPWRHLMQRLQEGCLLVQKAGKVAVKALIP